MINEQTVQVYVAGPLFTQAEWQWNAKLAEGLREAGITVILPQEAAVPMLVGERQFDPQGLFDTNITGIEASDIVIAIMDQSDPDSGTCWECGYAFRCQKPIIGIRTDLRPAGDDDKRPVNLMLARSCSAFISLPPAERDNLMWLVSAIITEIAGLQ